MASNMLTPRLAPPDATCYICLDDGADDQPLRRDCACRGLAGYAHRGCLARFATSKLDSMLKKLCQDENVPDKHLIEPFLACGQCNQPRQGQLMVDMTLEYVSALKARLPDNHLARFTSRLCLGSAYKQQNFLDSTYTGKAMAQYAKVINKLKEERRDLILAVPGLPSGHPDQHMLSDMVKCDTLAIASDLLAECYEERGIYASAAKHYEVALKLLLKLPFQERYGELLMKLDRVRNRMRDNGRPGLNYISHQRMKLAQIEKKLGKSCPEALIEKEKLATALVDHGELEEAHRLAIALHAQCMRVFGPDHLRTKDIELLVIQVSAKKGSNTAQASTDEAIVGAAASIAAMHLNESAGARSNSSASTGRSKGNTGGTETGAKRRGKKKKGRRRRK